MKSGLPMRAYLIGIVLAVALPFAALLAYTIYDEARDNAIDKAAAVSRIAARTAQQVSRFLAGNRLALETLAQRQSSRLLDPARCKPMVSDLLPFNPAFANVLVRDRTGNAVCAAVRDAGIPQLASDPESFEIALRENRFVIGKPLVEDTVRRWVVQLGQPIRDGQGQAIGVIGAPIDLVTFSLIATDPNTPARAITRIADAAGTVIASSQDPEHWVGRNARDTPIIRTVLAQRHGEARAVGIDGSESILGFTSVPGTDWFVVSSIPVEVVDVGMKQQLRKGALAAGVILAVVLVLSYVFARAIMVPMKSIAMTASGIAAGNLDVRAKPGGPRELAAVATQFNAMLDAQVAAFRELREDEGKLRQQALIFENATDAIMILDLRRRIVDWNPASERLYGYRKDEVLGRTTEFLYRPEEYAKYTKLIDETLARGKRWTIERVMLCKDGAERICEAMRAPLLDTGGTLIGRIGVTRDITERKRAEETQALLAAIVENSNEAILSRALDGKIISWNAAAERLLGYTAAEAVGRDLVEIFPPELRPQVVANRDLVRGGQLVSNQEAVRVTKDGRRIDVALSVFLVKDSHGHVVGTASTARDITERKRMEKELRSSHKQLRALAVRLNVVREEEIAILAREIHDELDQALTALKMDVFWLASRLPENKQALAEKARSMLALIDVTIRSVRDIGKRLRPRMLDDLGLIPAVEWQTQEFQKRTGIKCEMVTSVDAVTLEPERSTVIFRIIQEALTNVVRHAAATRVDIDFHEETGCLMLEIRDNGKGIRADEIENTQSLGLLGMRERALVLGGQLTVEGFRGKGTVISLRLPFPSQ